jgi:polygalacturonase
LRRWLACSVIVFFLPVLTLTPYRPDHFIELHDSTNLTVTNLFIRNWPVHLFDITGNTGVTISGLVLDNSAGDAPNNISDGLQAAHNTDGFDVSSSTNVLIEKTWIHNQDDCVAVTSGSNVVVDEIYCYGGHGLSIGSVGGKSNNTVDGVVFSNSVLVNTQNGARIKTNFNTTGSVSFPP